MKYEINNIYDIAFIQNEDFTFKTIKNRFGVEGSFYSSTTVEKCFKDDRINVVIVGKDGEILSHKYIEKKHATVSYSFKDSLEDVINTIDNEEEIKI